VVEALGRRADTLVIGGGMAYTFLRARGEPVGRSLLEPGFLDAARRLLDGPVEIVLPHDHVVAPSPEEAAQVETVEEIPEDRMGLDIGPRSVTEIVQRLEGCRTVFWNGPLGLFERPPFDRGTYAVAEALACAGAFSVVGGGDSVAAVRAAGVVDRIDHVSTGGGAALEFVAGKTLPGIRVLEERG
jgi:phosphoglycerate kinase